MVGRVFELWSRAANLSREDWVYLVTAVKELFIARFYHFALPIDKILKQLRQELQPSENELWSSGEVDVPRLSWAIGAVAARVPWRADCLLRVMAANRWLRRRRARPEFFLGVTKDATGRIEFTCLA